MAEIFYWKGGDTYPAKTSGDGLATGVTANRDYIWNNPDNWFVQAESGVTLTSSSASYNNNGLQKYYKRATRIPHGDDIVNFKALGSQQGLGLSGGPWPKTPMLMGGMRKIGNTLEWIGSYGTTAERQGRCRSITVYPTYSIGSNGWAFGQEYFRTSVFVDGNTNGHQPGAYEFVGITLGSDIFAEKCSGERCVILGGTFGDVYSLGKATRSFTGIDTVNFLLAGNTKDGGAGSEILQFVRGNITNTLRIEGGVPEGAFKYSNFIVNNKMRNVIAYPKYAEHLDIITSEIENVFIAPQDASDSTGIRFKSAIGSATGVSIDNMTLYATNPLTGSTSSLVGSSSTGYGQEPWVRWDGGTIGNLQMEAGELELLDTADPKAFIIRGSVAGKSKIDLNSPDLFTQSRVGTAACGSDNEGLLVKDERVEIKFKPGTLVNSVTGISAESVYSFQLATPTPPSGGGK